MTGMTGISVYELFGKTKSAKWNRYFSGFPQSGVKRLSLPI